MRCFSQNYQRVLCTFTIFCSAVITFLAFNYFYKSNSYALTYNGKKLFGNVNNRYLCPYFRGGLGNHMFMYASLYGIAKKKNMTLVINEQDTINTVFKLNVLKLKNVKYICEQAVLVKEKRPCAYDLETFNFDPSTPVKLKGYLQSWKYFKHFEKELRKQFVFKEEVKQKAKDVIEKYTKEFTRNKANSENLKIIGVHIRRGDYLTTHNIKYGYNVASKAYLQKAFDHFRSKYKNCLFLVFTGTNKEDIKWRDENVHGQDVLKVAANDRNVDMCALTKCDHTIITVGSFGWWAAWLSNGTTIYFKDIAQENSSLRKDFSADMTDFFPDDWIGL
ncbi:FUT1_2 [Mytilus coruscus]|uniref:L-Fucosyltransferase n=1 Tax=Mytilus coruscus TaxID=42192 RepID=A0A6J8E0M1_MYTCO|nr:FUT1_2 [Mytilus coruscus]